MEEDEGEPPPAQEVVTDLTTVTRATAAVVTRWHVPPRELSAREGELHAVVDTLMSAAARAVQTVSPTPSDYDLIQDTNRIMQEATLLLMDTPVDTLLPLIQRTLLWYDGTRYHAMRTIATACTAWLRRHSTNSAHWESTMQRAARAWRLMRTLTLFTIHYAWTRAITISDTCAWRIQSAWQRSAIARLTRLRLIRARTAVIRGDALGALFLTVNNRVFINSCGSGFCLHCLQFRPYNAYTWEATLPGTARLRPSMAYRAVRYLTNQISRGPNSAVCTCGSMTVLPTEVLPPTQAQSTLVVYRMHMQMYGGRQMPSPQSTSTPRDGACNIQARSCVNPATPTSSPESLTSYPKCIRPDCPCTASYDGQPGNYCSLSCLKSGPCTANYHPVPFFLRDSNMPQSSATQAIAYQVHQNSSGRCLNSRDSSLSDTYNGGVCSDSEHTTITYPAYATTATLNDSGDESDAEVIDIFASLQDLTPPRPAQRDLLCQEQLTPDAVTTTTPAQTSPDVTEHAPFTPTSDHVAQPHEDATPAPGAPYIIRRVTRRARTPEMIPLQTGPDPASPRIAQQVGLNRPRYPALQRDAHGILRADVWCSPGRVLCAMQRPMAIGGATGTAAFLARRRLSGKHAPYINGAHYVDADVTCVQASNALLWCGAEIHTIENARWLLVDNVPTLRSTTTIRPGDVIRVDVSNYPLYGHYLAQMAAPYTPRVDDAPTQSPAYMSTSATPPPRPSKKTDTRWQYYRMPPQQRTHYRAYSEPYTPPHFVATSSPATHLAQSCLWKAMKVLHACREMMGAARYSMHARYGCWAVWPWVAAVLVTFCLTHSMAGALCVAMMLSEESARCHVTQSKPLPSATRRSKRKGHGVALMSRPAETSYENELRRNPCAHVQASGGMLAATMWVDTMAPRGVTGTLGAVHRVVRRDPGFKLETLGGLVPVQAVVDMGVYVRTQAGEFVYLIIPDCLYVPNAKAELYPVLTCFERLGCQHYFDGDAHIRLPGGDRVLIRSTPRGYALDVFYGPQPTGAHTRLLSADTARHRAPASSVAMAFTEQPSHDGPDLSVAQAVDTEWRRLAYPSAAPWRRIHRVAQGLKVSDAPPLRNPLSVPAVVRGRMRAVPYREKPDGNKILRAKLLDKLYMDFAGPTVPSIFGGTKHYCGVIDRYSGYARVFPCHSETKEAATETLSAFLTDVRTLAKLPQLAAHVVRVDQGSAFMSRYFTEFVQHVVGAKHSPACTYSPQQNPFIERMWGDIFGTARVLLAAANLPPSFHPYAISTAVWLRNRLPSSTRGGLSPYMLIAKRKADMRFLRCFGCACAVYSPVGERKLTHQHDSHGKKLTDRGCDGIYLGPSDESPGHTVYIPSRHIVVTSRDVIFDETRYPGAAKLPAFDWFAKQPEAETKITEVTATKLKPDHNSDDSDISGDDENHNTINETQEQMYNRIARQARVNALTPVAGAGRHQLQTHDPSSVHFQRNHPHRHRARTPLFDMTANPTRAQSYDARAYYTDPTHAAPQDAAKNFSSLCLRTQPAYPHFVYQSAVGYSTVIRPTLEFGDVSVPSSCRAAMASPQKSYWQEAIDKEYKGLMERNTWETVHEHDVPASATLLNCHVVFALKKLASGEIDKFKARLVADGSQIKGGLNYERVFATVVKLSTLRMVLMIACARGYLLSSVDVRQAYLLADLPTPQYMRMPPGLPRYTKEGKVLHLKLKKSLYGLPTAAKSWADLLAAFMIEWKFQRSTIDVCLFTFAGGAPHGGHTMSVCVWVDDLVISTSSQDLRDSFVSDLHKRFPVDDKGNLQWILGISVKRDPHNRTLTLSQEQYTNEILSKHALHLEGISRHFDSPMADDKKYSSDQCPAHESPEWFEMRDKADTYMTLVGAILWLAACTRPDLAYAMSVLARFVSNPAKIHYVALQRVLVYVRDTASQELVFRAPKSNSDPLVLTAYSDANWAENQSTCGACLFLGGCLINWYSRLQKSVSHSSAESEYVAASMAAREAIFIRDVLTDLGELRPGPTTLYLDSKSAIDMAFDPVAFKKTKHILRDAFFLRDKVARQVFSPVHVSSEEQLADMLTKAVNKAIFTRLRDRLLGMSVTVAGTAASRRG